MLGYMHSRANSLLSISVIHEAGYLKRTKTNPSTSKYKSITEVTVIHIRLDAVLRLNVTIRVEEFRSVVDVRILAKGPCKECVR